MNSESARYPLSMFQEGLWYFERLKPNTSIYHIPLAFELDSLLKPDIFQKALWLLIERHEILRTCFQFTDDGVSQVINDQYVPEIDSVDLSHLPSSRQQKELTRHIRELNATPFDLTQGGMIRATVYSLGEERSAIALIVHHLIFDDWSIKILLDDLFSYYNALIADHPIQQPELPVQYVDFAVWQREEMNLEDGLAFWKKKLANVDHYLQMPTDFPRPPEFSFEGKTIDFEIPSDQVHLLTLFTQQQQTTLFNALLSIYGFLLRCFANKSNLTIGVPVSNRNFAEIEQLVGLFVNTLPLSLDIDDEDSFAELVSKTSANLFEALNYQGIPLEKIVGAINPRRSLSHNSLFQVMFNFLGDSTDTFVIEGVTFKQLRVSVDVAKFDLSLAMAQHGESIRGSLEYNSDIFRHETASQLVKTYLHLLNKLLEKPAVALKDILLVSEAEQKLLLDDYNKTSCDFPEDAMLHTLFEKMAVSMPDHTAVRTPTEQISYQELNKRSNQVAHYLLSLGCEPGQMIPLLIDRRVDMIVALLGILKAGCAYVPLSVDYPDKRIHYILMDTAAKFILTLPEFGSRLPEAVERIYCDSAVIREYPGHAPEPVITPDMLAYIIYTSGSTGTPKGVQIHHESIVNLIIYAIKRFDLDISCRTLQFPSITFDVATCDIFMTLCSGATICLAPPDETLVGLNLLKRLQFFEATHLSITPSALATLPETHLPELRVLIVAGEVCQAELVNRWAPHCDFYNAYGPTEATVYTTVMQCHPSNIAPSIGRPIANMKAYILNEHLRPVPPGFLGRLYIGGQGLARGYYNLPELSASKFIDWLPGLHRVYNSGDLARFDPDGLLLFHGRVDTQVKLRGYRIELEEIEQCLLRHDAVQASIVMVDDSLGDSQLAGFWVSSRDSTINQTQLKLHLQQYLPEYMMPARLIELTEIPLTPNGKVDYARLKDYIENSTSEITISGSTKLSHTEKQLAEIWQHLLASDHFMHDSSFFDVGGTSLLAAYLEISIQKHFHIKTNIGLIYAHASLREMAQIIELEQIRQLGTEETNVIINEVINTNT